MIGFVRAALPALPPAVGNRRKTCGGASISHQNPLIARGLVVFGQRGPTHKNCGPALTSPNGNTYQMYVTSILYPHLNSTPPPTVFLSLSFGHPSIVLRDYWGDSMMSHYINRQGRGGVEYFNPSVARTVYNVASGGEFG